MPEKKEYIPPVGPGSKSFNIGGLRPSPKFESNDEPREHTPPVGPGSTSLPPLGSHRDSEVVRALINKATRET